ncbi:hypothetical protein WJX73_005815 [Symbiochloris irregularis]|uniref:Protein kinase domain-containing protein n=1 Tax=Symbiochloris irregularis TaxID=706552 RepID=A0AAW1PGC4_9CHLO
MRLAQLACLVVAFVLTVAADRAEANVTRARWLQVQSQYLYNEGVALGYGAGAGVTLFPQGSAITTPGGCRHFGGDPSGFNIFSIKPIPQQPVTNMTEYVARWQHPTQGSIFGKSSADNCGPCNNVCPCNLTDGRAFGYFPLGDTLPDGPYNYGMFDDHYGWEATAQQPFQPKETGYDGNEQSTYNTTFEILLQPHPEDGFTYGWVNLTDAMRSSDTAFHVNNLAPCCIPISSGDSENLFVDNSNTSAPWYLSFRANGANTTGSFMGQCDLSTGEAYFTWYAFAYSHVPGDKEPQVLVIIPASATAVHTAPVSTGNLSAGPPTMLQSLPLSDSSSSRTFSAVGWVPVFDNYTVFPETPRRAAGILDQCTTFITTDNETATFVPEWYTSAGLFYGSVPQEATTPVSCPAIFWILQDGDNLDSSVGKYGAYYNYTWATMDESSSKTSAGDNQFLLQVQGLTPCCIPSIVPSTNRSDPGGVEIGNVIGWCDVAAKTAHITWLGHILPQDYKQAQLLNVAFTELPGSTKGKLGSWGGSFGKASGKRVSEDSAMEGEAGSRVALANDRFFNLLPFVNRMPRNQFYANLALKVAHGCLSKWTNLKGTQARKLNHGVLDDRYSGKAAQALAYAILKHESLWSATDRAIVQQWPKGSRGKKRIIADIEDILSSPDTTDFLEGLDMEPLYADEIDSGGCCTTLARMFCCALPPHRIREFTDGTSTYDSALEDTLDNESTYLSCMDSLRKDPADILSGILKGLHLSDWEIKAAELDILQHPDGSKVILGAGAFGQVFKARWNGVQTVAVKQLIQATSDKAKTEFLREVAILKKLRAENVVRFLGVSADQEQTMLVTEFMAGGDLFHAMRSSNRKSEFNWYNTGRRIALDVARGLAFLHSQHIVHFDLKSPNILLARDLTAKIADVGLAKIMQGELFTNVSAIGTMAWAAPELLTGQGDVSAKLDVYSEGVVLWEIVTQETPRFGQQWWRAPRVPEECPEWVAALIEQCMSPDQSKRPTSREVYQRLQSGGEPLGNKQE